MRRAIAALLLGIAACPSAASTPAAWAEEARAARAACVAASGLSGPRVSPAAQFDDRSALDAMLLGGRFRAHPSLRVTMLCLYDRRSRRATVTEAQGWPEVPLTAATSPKARTAGDRGNRRR